MCCNFRTFLLLQLWNFCAVIFVIMNQNWFCKCLYIVLCCWITWKINIWPNFASLSLVGWWYGVVGHLESCDEREHHCCCHKDGKNLQSNLGLYFYLDDYSKIARTCRMIIRVYPIDGFTKNLRIFPMLPSSLWTL